ncbi:MAG: hypothetical protein LBI49_14465, partial [Nocardiopsaceae bacterium]|nr:hypothetical protein [Nocardiopsaceae bacterium]
AAAGGALAQATSDLVPYALLAGACLATLAALAARSLGGRARALAGNRARQAGSRQSPGM